MGCTSSSPLNSRCTNDGNTSAIDQSKGSTTTNDVATTDSASLSSNQLKLANANSNEVQTSTGSRSRVVCLNDLEPSSGTAWSSVRPGPPPSELQAAHCDDTARKVPPPLPQRPLDTTRDSFSRPTLVSGLPQSLPQDPSPPRSTSSRARGRLSELLARSPIDTTGSFSITRPRPLHELSAANSNPLQAMVGSPLLTGGGLLSGFDNGVPLEESILTNLSASSANQLDSLKKSNSKSSNKLVSKDMGASDRYGNGSFDSQHRRLTVRSLQPTSTKSDTKDSKRSRHTNERAVPLAQVEAALVRIASNKSNGSSSNGSIRNSSSSSSCFSSSTTTLNSQRASRRSASEGRAEPRTRAGSRDQSPVGTVRSTARRSSSNSRVVGTSSASYGSKSNSNSSSKGSSSSSVPASQRSGSAPRTNSAPAGTRPAIRRPSASSSPNSTNSSGRKTSSSSSSSNLDKVHASPAKLTIRTGASSPAPAAGVAGRRATRSPSPLRKGTSSPSMKSDSTSASAPKAKQTIARSSSDSSAPARSRAASPRPLIARRPRVAAASNGDRGREQSSSSSGSPKPLPGRSSSPLPVQRTGSLEQDMLVEELLITPSAHARRSTSFDHSLSQEPEDGSPREEESLDERAQKVRSSGTWDEFEDGAALHLPTTSPASDEQASGGDLVKGNAKAGSAVGKAANAERSHLTRSESNNAIDSTSSSNSLGGSSDYGSSSSSSSFMSGSGSSIGDSSSPHSSSNGALRSGGSRVKTLSSSMLSLPEPESPSTPSPTSSKLPHAAKSTEALGAELEGLRTRLNSLSGSGDLSGVAFAGPKSNGGDVETF